MPLFFQENCTPPIITLNPEESKHLVRVLRKNVGDEVRVTDGLGKLFFCVIDQADPKQARLQVKKEETVPKNPYQIHLAIAPTKSPDRMEWMVEKITEIGFDKIYLIKSENSERSFLKTDRLEKKIIAACKQSLQFHKPEIESDWTFDKLIGSSDFDKFQKFIAYVDENHQNHLLGLAQPNQNYLILIGPEGDFSPEEIQAAIAAGFAPISLGKNRLRTETAGLAAVQMLQVLNR
ncbi:16S rRNA (uracil(1498)-N(3))-methyltransferase [Algoriphagus hitonicola]|uniref:Ribosomal RNA small subunit methyltransferase E n=1 Tax=Algoriphagus hitonicola TaxID=435880 RepID=A0A1I2TRK1_9BACT|nr:16S rRNA (uracil(1498)-N(3))-methyltransferase [Algoriphagus hitonicola]SFG66809.1 16S rRNA (uracil1498-N3)-methyltransferase [Algoriphagus hitonicola]